MEFKALSKIIKIILGIFVLLFIVALFSGGDDSTSSQVQEPDTASEATTEQKNVTTSSSDETVKETTSSEEPEKETSSSDETVKETTSSEEPEKETSSSEEPEKEIVSTSFSDFALYSDSTATSLQKESFFDDNYKGKYVTWSGTVSSVSESYGSYTVQVKHKSSTLVSDVIVKMRDDQKDKLLQLKEGSPITYTAKMTRYGDILGMSAEDGTIE
jgi:cytoskeletal protein RodZ